MADFSHLNTKMLPAIVNVRDKSATHRRAVAKAIVQLPEAVMVRLQEGNFNTPKGAIFQTAILAGIMASKKTGDLIPLCHPIGLENCEISIEVNTKDEIEIRCLAEVEAKTGVEMEALTGATIAALTIYDMCKALSQEIMIKEICLIEKSGGKNDFSRE